MLSSRLQQLTQFVRTDLRADTERGRLIRSTVTNAGQNAIATLLAFGASLVYARGLGPHGYGLYAYVIAWVAILSILVSMGIPPYLIREGVKPSNCLRALRRWGDSRVVLSGIVAMVIMASIVFVPYAAGARWLFLIAAPLPLLVGATSVRSSLMQARGYIARSQWPRLLLTPGLTLAAFSYLWVWRGSASALDLVVITVSVTLMSLVIATLQLRGVAADDSGIGSASPRMREALPFMWVEGLLLLNGRVDLIILGVLNGAHDVGVYAIASRAAALTCFLMTAANLILAPKIAQLYHSGELALLARMVRGATYRIMAFSVPIALVLIVAAEPVLTRFYGEEFADGAVLLKILAIAQIITVASGPLGTLLIMTGHEKVMARNLLVTVLLNIMLNILLIPKFGAVGAAVATASSLTVSRAFLWYLVRRHLQFHRIGTRLG